MPSKSLRKIFNKMVAASGGPTAFVSNQVLIAHFADNADDILGGTTDVQLSNLPSTEISDGETYRIIGDVVYPDDASHLISPGAKRSIGINGVVIPEGATDTRAILIIVATGEFSYNDFGVTEEIALTEDIGSGLFKQTRIVTLGEPSGFFEIENETSGNIQVSSIQFRMFLGSRGAELLSDPLLDTGSGWTTISGASISGGAAHLEDDSEGISQFPSLTTDSVYQVVINAVAIAVDATGLVVKVGDSDPITVDINPESESEVFTFYMVCGAVPSNGITIFSHDHEMQVRSVSLRKVLQGNLLSFTTLGLNDDSSGISDLTYNLSPVGIGEVWTGSELVTRLMSYDPTNDYLGDSDASSSFVTYTVSEAQGAASSSGFDAGGLYKILEPGGYAGSYIIVMAVSSSELAPTGYGMFKNTAMTVARPAEMDWIFDPAGDGDKIMRVKAYPVQDDFGGDLVYPPNEVICNYDTFTIIGLFPFDDEDVYDNLIKDCGALTNFSIGTFKHNRFDGLNYLNIEHSSNVNGCRAGGGETTFDVGSVATCDMTNIVVGPGSTLTAPDTANLSNCRIADGKTLDLTGVSGYTASSKVLDAHGSMFEVTLGNTAVSGGGTILTVPNWAGRINCGITSGVVNIETITTTATHNLRFLSSENIVNFNNNNSITLVGGLVSITNNQFDFVEFMWNADQVGWVQYASETF